MLNYIKNNNILYDQLFKITGRYKLNNEFNFNNYNNDSNIFKQYKELEKNRWTYILLYLFL